MKVVTFNVEQFRRQLAVLLNRVGYGSEQVIVERYGAPIAVLLPYEAYRSLNYSAGIKTEPPSESVSPQEDNTGSYAPFERLPLLAEALEKAVREAGLNYQTLAEGLRAERERTLMERYPDFASSYGATESP